MPAAIRLITFDLDDTLWPCRPVIRRAERVLYEWLQVHAPRVTDAMSLEAMWEHRKAFMGAHPELLHDLTLVRLRTLEEVMARHGYPALLAEEATAVFRAARNRVEPYPEVVPVLERLRENYLLVSVTNGNAQVEETPLKGLFHLNLTAAEVGAAKPDPAIFHAAAKWGGVAPQEMLHVGDDPERDVLAARRAGMAGVWVVREGEPVWPLLEHPAPLSVIRDISELPDLPAVRRRASPGV